MTADPNMRNHGESDAYSNDGSDVIANQTDTSSEAIFRAAFTIVTGDAGSAEYHAAIQALAELSEGGNYDATSILHGLGISSPNWRSL